jgi:hypothetical protein
MTLELKFTQPEILNIDKAVEGIMNNREKILEAFIAKYGWSPDKIVQVLEFTRTGMSWSLRVKE